MQLAFLLFNYFPYGGLQRDFLAIALACRRRGAEVRAYAMQWRGERPEGIELWLYPGRGLSRSARRADFVARAREEIARQGADAVVGFNRMPGLDWYYAADSCFADKALSRGLLYRLAPRTRQYLAWERAVFDPAGTTRVMLLSPPQRESYIRHYPLPASRLVELPPGIREDRRAGPDAAALRASFREEFGVAGDELLLLQIGSGFRVKGVDRALRALAAMPASLRARCRYVLVGQDKPAPYRRLARRLGLAPRVTILPGRDDIPRFLQGADLMLHPARSESAGIALLEAVVAGLPVLCTDTCGYAFHVRRAGAGRVCESPFRQQRLNALLQEMLTGDLGAWRAAGIAYGRSHDLYHLPERAAAHIMNDE